LLTYVAREINADRIRTTVAEVLKPINTANMCRAHAMVEAGMAKGKIVLERFQ
jgi:NADPH:quinone reductase